LKTDGRTISQLERARQARERVTLRRVHRFMSTIVARLIVLRHASTPVGSTSRLLGNFHGSEA